MKRFINFGSIKHFRNIITDITHMTRYEGKDGIIYNNNTLPVLQVTGSEKIHGTNAAVCYSDVDGFWVQGKDNIITPEHDNAGCAFVAENKKDVWIHLIKELAKLHNIDLNKNIISVYYEWCGGNIQKKSAVSGLNKMAIIFAHFKVSPSDNSTDTNAYWLDTSKDIIAIEHGIRNIKEFPMYELDIDFEKAAEAMDKMSNLVEILEVNSPVGQKLGKEFNIGEGIVFTVLYKDVLLRWKVKGEAHHKTKVKTLTPVDNEVEQLKINIAQQVTPAWRLEQIWINIFGFENEKAELSMLSIGLFLKALMNDIIKEESDILVLNGLFPKDISNKINTIGRIWFQEQLDILMKDN